MVVLVSLPGGDGAGRDGIRASGGEQWKLPSKNRGVPEDVAVAAAVVVAAAAVGVAASCCDEPKRREHRPLATRIPAAANPAAPGGSEEAAQRCRSASKPSPKGIRHRLRSSLHYVNIDNHREKQKKIVNWFVTFVLDDFQSGTERNDSRRCSRRDYLLSLLLDLLLGVWMLRVMPVLLLLLLLMLERRCRWHNATRLPGWGIRRSSRRLILCQPIKCKSNCRSTLPLNRPVYKSHLPEVGVWERRPAAGQRLPMPTNAGAERRALAALPTAAVEAAERPPASSGNAGRKPLPVSAPAFRASQLPPNVPNQSRWRTRLGPTPPFWRWNQHFRLHKFTST